MFLLRKKENPVFKEMDGREVKYVTRRDKNHKECIVGKSGRIVIVGDEIRILCGETDVFKSPKDQAVCFRLMSGDGITVSGFNRVLNDDDNITVYYKYHRK